VDAFVAQLPFALTHDQQGTIDEITRDMAAGAPMHRLLQGDVGSGKTVVALAALLIAVQGGYQGAFMAPTEVLAEQHYLGSVKMLEGLTVGAPGSLLGDRPVRVELLTNRTTATERRRIAAGLARNEVDILVGTHALLYGDLDKSELREMPPGRTPIETKVVGPEPLDQAAMWKRLRAEVEGGHQAYVVCPLVEEKAKLEAKAATAEFELLQAEELAGL